MNILHLIQRYAPAVGGAEQHLGEISAYLAAQGHRVTVATTNALDFEHFWDPRRRTLTEPAGEVAGVQVMRFPVRHVPPPALAYAAVRRLLWLLSALRPVPTPLLHRLARLTPWVPGLWRWLAETEERFDVVAGMTICFEPLLEAGLRLAQRRAIPFIAYPLTHLGAGPEPASDPLSRFYTMRHQLDIVRASDAVVAQTRTEKGYFVTQGATAERIAVVGPGIEPSKVLGGDGARARERFGLKTPIILSLSSMSHDKGTPHTVEAVRQLWQAGREVELVLVGALLEPFQRFLATLPAADRAQLRVLGSVDEATKRDLLAAADMLVMPSRTDSFGLVYLEAWLYRKPVIGARTWGVTDVITDGEDGLLVPFADVPALRGAIAHLLDRPEEAAAMGVRGEAKVYGAHTWAHKLPSIEALYRRVVEARASRV